MDPRDLEPVQLAAGAAVLVLSLLVGVFVGWRIRLGRRLPWGIPDVAAAFAVLLWVSALGSLALMRLLLGQWTGEPNLLVAVGGTAAGALAASIFILSRASLKGLGLDRLAGRWCLRGLLLVVPFLLLSAGWVYLLEWLGYEVPPQALLALVEAESNPLVLLLALFYGAVGAPVTEELLFRGFLQPALARPFGVSTAITVQGLLFGVVHGADPPSILPLALLGVLLGWLRLRSDSLWPAIVTHAGNNAVALSLAVAGLIE